MDLQGENRAHRQLQQRRRRGSARAARERRAQSLERIRRASLGRVDVGDQQEPREARAGARAAEKLAGRSLREVEHQLVDKGVGLALGAVAQRGGRFRTRCVGKTREQAPARFGRVRIGGQSLPRRRDLLGGRARAAGQQLEGLSQPHESIGIGLESNARRTPEVGVADPGAVEGAAVPELQPRARLGLDHGR